MKSEPRHRTVRIPRGVRLDLGSSAKAFGADRAAARRGADRHGHPRQPRWRRRGRRPTPGRRVGEGIARESATPAERVDQVVAIAQGGLASSAASVRTWRVCDRAVQLAVRVPESLRQSRFIRLEVERWVQLRLIDVLVWARAECLVTTSVSCRKL